MRARLRSSWRRYGCRVPRRPRAARSLRPRAVRSSTTPSAFTCETVSVARSRQAASAPAHSLNACASPCILTRRLLHVDRRARGPPVRFGPSVSDTHQMPIRCPSQMIRHQSHAHHTPIRRPPEDSHSSSVHQILINASQCDHSIPTPPRPQQYATPLRTRCDLTLVLALTLTLTLTLTHRGPGATASTRTCPRCAAWQQSWARGTRCPSLSMQALPASACGRAEHDVRATLL